MPPAAAQQALSRIIPSPLKEISEKNVSIGAILIKTIPEKPSKHPAIFLLLKASSLKIKLDQMINRKPPMESRIVDLELGI